MKAQRQKQKELAAVQPNGERANVSSMVARSGMKRAAILFSSRIIEWSLPQRQARQFN